MSITTLQLTPRDPLIARDGRPFGAGQGNRMRSLSWLLPSVVAGSFRTALVKADPALDFTGEMPQQLMAIEVAGPFPMKNAKLYLPAPNDCVWDEKTGQVFRVAPVPLKEGEGVFPVCGLDFLVGGLDPVRLTEEQAPEDFKAKKIPAWWPLEKYTNWLIEGVWERPSEWFDSSFLEAPIPETRDHVCLDPQTGAAAEGQIFATSGLNVTHLSKFGVGSSERFQDRFAEITLSVRVTIPGNAFDHVNRLNAWYPLGGERRLVHWQQADRTDSWNCPENVRSALESASRFRMVLATPAIFEHGWRPGWLNAETLTGKPFDDGPSMRLVGVTNPRWKAVSGWSLAPPRGPKAIRRMVPAGSVYFFEKVDGDGRSLASNGWLRPVSDAPQDRNDGFGLAIWGTW